MKIPEKELKVAFYRARGPGGQRKNKRETAVRIVHLPTGITVRGREFRSQADNRELALRRLEDRLEKLAEKRKVRVPTRKPVCVKRAEKTLGQKLSWKKRQRQKVSLSEEM